MSKEKPTAQMSQALLQYVRQLQLPWSKLKVLIGLLALEICLLESDTGDQPWPPFRVFPMRLLREWAGLASANDNGAVKRAAPAMMQSGLFSDLVTDGRLIFWQISPLAVQLIEEKFFRYSSIDLDQFRALRSAVAFEVYADLVRVYRMKAPRFFYTFGAGEADICGSWPNFRPKLVRALHELGPVFGCQFHIVLQTDHVTNRVVLAEIRVGHSEANWFKGAYAISLAKALVASHDTVVTSIAELLDPEYLRAAAEALSEANGGGRTSEYLASVLKTMKKIAIGYLAAPEADIDEIRSLIRFYGTGRRGMSPKNKRKLRGFTEPRIQATINLSGTVLKGINAEIDRRRKAQRKKTGKLPERIAVIDSEMARDIAAVVAHDILLSRAPRSANVIGVMLDWIAFQDGRARIIVPAPEVKGRSSGDPDYVVCPSASASRLMQDYMEKVRPILLQEEDKANPYLFPGQAAKEVDAPYRSILKRVTRLLFAHVGVRINPHLYRHLIGWIWLKQSIDNLPRVQRLLGHKTLKTTVEYYAELDETLVMDGWQNHLEDRRTAAA